MFCALSIPSHSIKNRIPFLCMGVSYAFGIISVPDGCHWGDFGGWSGCSKDCGGGRRTRVRTRRRMPLTGSTRGNGACKGYGVETEACNSHDCRGHFL